MKKTIIYFFLFIFICFFLPILLTIKDKEVISPLEEKNKSLKSSNNDSVNNDTDDNNNNSNNNENVDNKESILSNENSENSNNLAENKNIQNGKFSNITTIKLLHAKTQEIEEINIETYLYHVVSAEMPADFELEALKAQAVAARTYTIYRILQTEKKHEGADLCDESTCCQAWITKENRLSYWEESERENKWNKIVRAVDETKGKVITYEGEPINAFFHSNSGGITEIPINVWGGSGYPYLQAVETSGEEEYTQYRSEVVFTKLELESIMRGSYPDFKIDYLEENPIQILEFTSSNRVKTIKIGNTQISGIEARKIFKLKSAKFEFSINDNNVTFSVIGSGHGVGMSQTGANTMALNGANFEEIIKHFYRGVEIET